RADMPTTSDNSTRASMFFFFSSRRRHTRWPRDWSSDVCSSDLIVRRVVDQIDVAAEERAVRPLHRARGGDEDLRRAADRKHEVVDRKSTRLNSSHVAISYAVFCLKKKILRSTSCFRPA